MACSLPAGAQFYSVGGSVYTFPTNLFPISPGIALLDLGFDNSLIVGGAADGSFSALLGAQLSVGALETADGGLNSGTTVVNGAQVSLGGSGNRLVVGKWGSADMTVSNGGLVDATLNSGACLVAGASCVSMVGNGAGSNATLNVSGSGSEVRTLRDFVVGGVNVYTQAAGGFDLGTAGGTTNAFVNVLAGGTLRTQGASVGVAPGGPAALGSEKSFATVVVDGPGSQWFVTRNAVDNVDLRFDAATAANSKATITLGNGGRLVIDASGATGSENNVTLGANGGQADLTIQSGAKMVVTGSYPGTGNFPTGTFFVGGSGAGTRAHLVVTGAGSELLQTKAYNGGFLIGATGSTAQLDVLAGGRVTTEGGLYAGVSGSNATVNVDASFVDVSASDNRMVIGLGGTVVMTVSNGGKVDAAIPEPFCQAGGCGTTVSGGAGGTASLTITGAGSEVRTLRSFTLAQPGVDLSNNAGVPGGDATGNISILAGGSLRTEGATVGAGPSGSALGTERSFASVLIDGPGSQWIVSRNSVDNRAALMGIATAANATATVTVSGGGLLRIDGSGSAGPNDGLNVGSNGKGSLTVTGSASRVETAGVNHFINVGANNSAGDGNLQILAGATAATLYGNVGRSGGKGVLLIDGAGSTLTQSGVGTAIAGTGNTGGPAGTSIGRAGGTGQATVSNGGRWFISDGGGDDRASGSSPGVSVGFAQGVAGSNGSLTIDGAGSVVEVVGNTLGLAAGQPDNFNPFVAVGRDPGSNGSLTVSAGGKLQLTGNAVSTVANSRSTTFQVGGISDTALGGTGTATITGPGSQVRVEGSDPFVGVGRNGTGTLTMTNQALLVSRGVSVGRAAAGVGTLVVDGSRIELSGQQTGNNLAGANFSVGLAGGSGTATIGNGSVVAITNLGSAGASFNLGGTGNFPLGHGELTLGGGSQITIVAAPGLGAFSVGRDGSGVATLTGASLVDVSGGNFHVGRLAGADGQLSMSGGARLLADTGGIGGSSDTTAGGQGTATISGPGTEISLAGPNGFLSVGRNGDGTLTVANQGKVSGIVTNVGRVGGVGKLTVDNAFIQMSGQQTAGNQLGATLGVGVAGGSGRADIINGSQVTLSNTGTAAVWLNLGGSPTSPLGSGTLNVDGGSQIRLQANPGLAIARIGHDGGGQATFSNGSLLSLSSGGQVIIAGQPGSTGTLTLNSGSVLNADYVGVGSNPGGIDGGTGFLYLRNSTINATTVEIGSLSLLGGGGGLIHAEVINRGTLAPGDSPGRVTIDGRFNNTPTAKLVLDVEDTGGGSFVTDQIVLVEGTSYTLGNIAVVFNFIGATDPNAFGASGGFDLDTFLVSRSAAGAETGLSSTFTGGASWNEVLAGAQFSAQSTTYAVSTLTIAPNGSGSFHVVATPIPEPGTLALWFAGLCGLAGAARSRRRR